MIHPLGFRLLVMAVVARAAKDARSRSPVYCRIRARDKARQWLVTDGIEWLHAIGYRVEKRDITKEWDGWNGKNQ